MGDYKDSEQRYDETRLEEKYLEAVALTEQGQEHHEKAREIFLELGSYKDAATYAQAFVQRAFTVQFAASPEYSIEYDDAGFAVNSIYYSAGYSWDSSHRTRKTVTNGNLPATIVEIFDDHGKKLQYSQLYSDGSGEKAEFTYAYNADGTVATRTEINKKAKNDKRFYEAVTVYTYNTQGQLVKSVENLAFELDRDIGKNTTAVTTVTYEYDENGNLVQKTEEYVSYNPSSYSDDVKTSSSITVYTYTYGWLYAPNAMGQPVILPNE